MMNPELIFEVIQSKAGGFKASCLNARIDTQAASLEDLNDKITAAVTAHYPGRTAPDPSAIHLVIFQE